MSPVKELPGNKLRTGHGKIKQFKSEQARKRWEDYNRALDHGWKPDHTERKRKGK